MVNKEFFTRVEQLYGENTNKYLAKAHMCIVGVGGVGSWALEALARSGVGELTIIDMDTVDPSNMNRQLSATTTSLNQVKVEVLAKRIAIINPACKVNFYAKELTLDNIATYIHSDFDYLLDAIDSIKTKAALLVHCRRNKIKVISAGGAGGLVDPTQIQIKDLAKTVHDPLASKLRSILRHEYALSTDSKGKFGIECVFSSEQQRFNEQYIDNKLVRTFGTCMPVTASFGLVAASRMINKYLAKQL